VGVRELETSTHELLYNLKELKLLFPQELECPPFRTTDVDVAVKVKHIVTSAVEATPG